MSASEAREESEVDDGDARGVSAGDMSAEDATLLEVVEVGFLLRAAPGDNAVVDMVRKRGTSRGLVDRLTSLRYAVKVGRNRMWMVGGGR